MTQLCDEFPTAALGYWHDIGHGQIRENLGLIHQESVARRLSSRLAGMHVHDVLGFTDDHLMPPNGSIKFERFRALAALDIPAVLEPAPGTPLEAVREAVDFLRTVWA
jgi:sugar phosphate isomerase/epimerase